MEVVDFIGLTQVFHNVATSLLALSSCIKSAKILMQLDISAHKWRKQDVEYLYKAYGQKVLTIYLYQVY